MNQDASLAILDDITGATSLVTEEAWEFHKGANGGDIYNPLYIIQKFTILILDQQKDMPNQIAKTLKDIVDTGNAAVTTSAAESEKSSKRQQQNPQKYCKPQLNP